MNSVNTFKQDISDPVTIPKEAITLQPVGIVRSTIAEPRFGGWTDHTSRVIVDESFTDALRDLQNYSHLMVVFWMHYVCYHKTLHVPQGKDAQGVPEVGIFACRCPARPNPVGCTTVKLLAIHGNSILVQGLDAVDETPVIDIKPVTPQYDCVAPDDVKVPEWIYRLDY
jgi:tRNA-Thr(GGU) m(6)t(6)A37 methyltransferase TsaA